MASSNKHWPSMFKSKPCNTTTATHHHHNQWQHDVISPSSLLSPSAFPNRTPYSSGGCEERTPEPKPRWNPKPEQIRILESIFNSGMVNPPRDEIRKIRAQLQEFGQVGDANVFYWFQNRKSRSKHKQQQRHLQTTTTSSNKPQQQQKNSPSTTNSATTTSSSSSEKSSPTKSVNQNYLQMHTPQPEFLPPEPFCFAATTTTGSSVFTSQGGGGFGFPTEMSSSGGIGVVNFGLQGGDQTDGNCCGMLLSELMMMSHHHQHPHGVAQKKVLVEEEEEKLMSYNNSAAAAAATTPSNPITSTTHAAAEGVFLPSTITSTTAVSVPSIINHILGAGVDESPAVGPAKSTVFINDVAFEVAVGPLNVREAFGDDAVLIHSSGHPVLTNEWGVTHQSLQHGGFYYLVRTLTPISTTSASSENITTMI